MLSVHCGLGVEPVHRVPPVRQNTITPSPPMATESLTLPYPTVKWTGGFPSESVRNICSMTTSWMRQNGVMTRGDTDDLKANCGEEDLKSSVKFLQSVPYDEEHCTMPSEDTTPMRNLKRLIPNRLTLSSTNHRQRLSPKRKLRCPNPRAKSEPEMMEKILPTLAFSCNPRVTDHSNTAVTSSTQLANSSLTSSGLSEEHLLNSRVCEGCRQWIIDRTYLSVGTRPWHSQCLHCHVCGLDLQWETVCYLHEGTVYCREHYERMIQCQHCGDRLHKADSIYRFGPSLVYHRHCLICVICSRIFVSGDAFVQNKYGIYCVTHIPQPGDSEATATVGTLQTLHQLTASSSNRVSPDSSTDSISVAAHPPTHSSSKRTLGNWKMDRRMSTLGRNLTKRVWAPSLSSTPIKSNESPVHLPDSAQMSPVENDQVAGYATQAPGFLSHYSDTSQIPTDAPDHELLFDLPRSEAVPTTNGQSPSSREHQLPSPTWNIKTEPSTARWVVPAVLADAETQLKVNSTDASLAESILSTTQVGMLETLVNMNSDRDEYRVGEDGHMILSSEPCGNDEVTNEGSINSKDSFEGCKLEPEEIEPTDLGRNSSHQSLLRGRKNGTQTEKIKRVRTSFKHQQLKVMKAFFENRQNPDSKDLKQLSLATGLSKRVLQVWFQNARAKFRRSVHASPSLSTNLETNTTSLTDRPPSIVLNPNNNPASPLSCGYPHDASLLLIPTIPYDSVGEVNASNMIGWNSSTAVGNNNHVSESKSFQYPCATVQTPMNQLPPSAEFGLWKHGSEMAPSLERDVNTFPSTSVFTFSLSSMGALNQEPSPWTAAGSINPASTSFDSTSTNSPTSQMYSSEEAGDTLGCSTFLADMDHNANGGQNFLPVYTR